MAADSVLLVLDMVSHQSKPSVLEALAWRSPPLSWCIASTACPRKKRLGCWSMPASATKPSVSKEEEGSKRNRWHASIMNARQRIISYIDKPAQAAARWLELKIPWLISGSKLDRYFYDIIAKVELIYRLE